MANSNNYRTTVKVEIKKRHQSPHAMTSSTSNHKQNTEEGQRSNGSKDRQNWIQILQENTQSNVKKSMQNLFCKNQHTKQISSSESKDNKKLSTPQQQLKYKNRSTNKQLDEVPIKQVPMQKISKEHVKKSQHTEFSSSMSSKCTKCKSVLVTDREVQCDRIFDSSYDKFSSFNPVRTLGFLIKELEYLIKDEKSSEILWEMEQILIRIPVEIKKSTTMDSEVSTPYRRFDESTMKLKKMSEQMNTFCGSLREERDSLKRDVEKHSKLLEEAWQKKSDLESIISKLKEELNEALKTIESKDETISELQEKNEIVEQLQQKLTELRTDLTKQIELTQQSRLEVQYLMLERDKLLVMSSHKDSQFNEYRNVMKEFQNEIEHLINYREENFNLQGSVIQCGLVCSSPSPISSDRSNIPIFRHDLLDTSISIINDNKNLKIAESKKDNLLTPSYRITEKDMTKTTMEEINESQNNKDSTQLEFISLPPAESILFPSYRDQECLDESDINKDKDDLFPSKSKLSDHVQQFVDTDCTKSSIHCITEKDNEKESYKKHLSKIRKTLQFDNKKKNYDNEGIEESSKFIETNVSGDIITSNINEQFQTIFDEVRRKCKISVNVPSPPRNYPHPDWTDSSLPSVSVDSELNIVQSNIT